MTSQLAKKEVMLPAQKRRVVLRLVTRSLLTFVLLLVGGNVVILTVSFWARSTTPTDQLSLDGVNNAVVVDDQVWRGAAPSEDGYRNLAAAGVTTIVDLRNDDERGDAVKVLDDLDLDVVRMPIRDGQLPSTDDVDRFLDVVASSDGRVFLHCGAGVGRTGAIAAAYLAQVHGVGGADAVRRNLAMGPPSLEQLAYAAGEGVRPPVFVSAVSRVLDAPRRIWHDLI